MKEYEVKIKRKSREITLTLPESELIGLKGLKKLRSGDFFLASDKYIPELLHTCQVVKIKRNPFTITYMTVEEGEYRNFYVDPVYFSDGILSLPGNYEVRLFNYKEAYEE